MNLSFFDYGIIGAYVILVLSLGLLFTKKHSSDEEYLLAGRRLTLPAMVMSLVTTWYGAILGVGEFVFGYGVVGWVTQGLMWYIVYFIFAYLLAKRVHATRYVTVADQLRNRSGKKSAFLGAILTYIMTSPAPYILSLGIVINVLFGLNLTISVVLGALISAVYVWTGGFKAVVRTDMFQFILMFVGFGSLIVASVYHFGGWSFLSANLPPSYLTLTGDLSLQTIIVWGLIAFWTLVDPNFFQRCYAAADERVARNGILWSILFWFIFDMMTLFTGLYARAAFPTADPLSIYFVLADNVLPFILKGIFLTAILAIIMSTIDSFLFAGSTIIGSDILKPYYPSKNIKTLIRIGLLITLVVSLVIIFVFQSVIGIIYAVGTVGVSALLFPVLLSLLLRRKTNDTIVLVSMITALMSSGIWLLHGWFSAVDGWPVYVLGIEPMYVGLFASALVLISSYKKLFIET